MRVWKTYTVLGLLLFGWMQCVCQATAQGTKFTFPPPTDAAEALRLAFYSYDQTLPLKSTLKPFDTDAIHTRYRLDYDSIHDQRVSALLSIPKGFSAPYPAVILVHGSGGNKNADYITLISNSLVKRGYVTLSIDTQYHGDRARPGRSGEIHMPDSYTMRDAWVQSVVDLRRAVDYLESRQDIVKSKIGYLGFSQGGMLGSVLGGVEERIACFCLAVPGGGLLNIVKNIDKYPFLQSKWPVKVTPELLVRAADITNVTDPLYFVGRIKPRPLLILVAKRDEIIPPEASAALVAAAHATPDEVKLCESGHVLNPNVVFDVRNFFVVHLGERSPTTALR